MADPVVEREDAEIRETTFRSRSSEGPMSAPTPLVLVLGADDRYAMPLAVTLYSCLSHLPIEARVRVHVLDGGIKAGNRQRVERVVRLARPNTQLEWHSLDSGRFVGMRLARRMSTAAYSRLLIPELLAEERVVVYMDSDVLIKKDLSALLKEFENSPGLPVLAVRDFYRDDLGDVFGDENCAALGLDPRSPYFNSGILVIDVERWRELHVTERAFAFVRESASMMRYHDQDALNAVLAGQWGQLEPRWNVMLDSVDFLRDRIGQDESSGSFDWDPVSDAFILHFIGNWKPWEGRYPGPARSQYVRAVRLCGWFESRWRFSLWRARLGLATAPWKAYRVLPGGLRTAARRLYGRG